MPVKDCQDSGKPGYKYGDSGKCYTYTPKDEVSRNKAKKQAIIQGIAIGEYAEIGERGGIKESKKAPKSDTPNPNPKGEGTAKGSASTTRGAEVTQEEIDLTLKAFSETKAKLDAGAYKVAEIPDMANK